MFASGKYSKTELDCLFDVYQKKGYEWVVVDCFEDKVSFDDKNEEEMAKFSIQVQKLFEEAGGSMENIDLSKLDSSRVDIAKVAENHRKRDHTKNICVEGSRYKQDANGNIVSIVYEARAIVITSVNKFLFRNIIEDGFVKVKDIEAVMQVGRSFKMHPTYLIMTVKGMLFCEKFCKKITT